MSAGYSALLAPIVVTDGDNSITVNYSTTVSIAAQTYANIEALLSALRTQLQAIDAGFDCVVATTDDDYGCHVSITHNTTPFVLSEPVDSLYAHIGLESTQGSPASQTFTGESCPASTLVVAGVGKSRYPTRLTVESGFRVGGQAITVVNSQIRTRDLEFTALTAAQCAALRDVWDSLFDNGDDYPAYYYEDYEFDEDGQFGETVVIDADTSKSLNFKAFGGDASGLWSAVVRCVVSGAAITATTPGGVSMAYTWINLDDGDDAGVLTTAQVTGFYAMRCDTSGSAFSYKLPASPADGAFIIGFVAGDNAFTLDGNGKNIDGESTQVFQNNKYFLTIFNNTDDEWYSEYGGVRALTYAGNPNGHVTGYYGDTCRDTTNGRNYYCATASGASSWEVM